MLSERLAAHLESLYGPERAAATLPRLLALVEAHRRGPGGPRPPLAERLGPGDALLITYGDQISAPGEPPLRSLHAFLNRHISGLISGVHILPFYPYTSDDGFSVVDYLAIDPALGGWPDIQALAGDFRLMVDAVVNHISASSAWFQAFLRGEPPYDQYFISVDPATDLSQVTRPRALPLLTPFETPGGTRHVWTTFSADQIDLNVANPEVLLELTRVLLSYAERGAEFIRLDAIGYLWKRAGTSCIHLPETHRVVQLWRDVLDAAAPSTILITETNVPHRDNISYFGDGSNEAQLVYQFPLAPLVLHAFAAEDAAPLTAWAAGLEPAGPQNGFFNFLASHDGIGVMPATGLLTPAQIEALVARALAHGGQVSYKNNPDGSRSPYELNITLFDALSDPGGAEAEERKIDRFICAQAIMLALAGLPGIYIHSLFGSPNHHAGAATTGRARSINREKWRASELEARLADPQSRAARVFGRYAALLRARAGQPALHPAAPQRVLDAGPGLFVLLRGEPGRQIICAHNVSARAQTLKLPDHSAGPLRDIISAEDIPAGLGQGLEIGPLGCRWLAGP